jgi:hypothetical protein
MISAGRSVDRWRGRPGVISNDLISLFPLFSSTGNFGIGVSHLGTELENGIDTFVRGRGRLRLQLGRGYSEFSVLRRSLVSNFMQTSACQ